jgi:hypothetical protein
MNTNNEMPNRDITGNCDEGECVNLAAVEQILNQAHIEAVGPESPEEYPHVKEAMSRNEQPGVWGGHV